MLDGFAKDLAKKGGQLILADLSAPVRQSLMMLAHMPNVRLVGPLEQAMAELRLLPGNQG